MHGRARVSVWHERSDAGTKEAARDREKAVHYAVLLAGVLRAHRQKDYRKEAVARSSELIRTNPDMYTAWNYRKSALKVILAEVDEAGKTSLLQEELRLSFEGLMVNPKAYGAWYHRKWTLDLMGPQAPLKEEFKLLEKLLAQDARNFHGWAYRRFLAGKADSPVEHEMDFSEQKIGENFSNFSAWHYRSKLLAQMHTSGTDASRDMQQASTWLESEFDFVDNALFSDHKDTSAWIYQTWLLQMMVPDSAPALIGLWPPPGCTVPIAMVSSQTQHLPAILLFSKAVTGVNRHTVPVTIRSDGTVERSTQEWQAVGLSREGASRVWVQKLQVPTGTSEVHIHMGAGPSVQSPAGLSVVQSTSSYFIVHTRDAADFISLSIDEDSQASTSELSAASDMRHALPTYAASSAPERDTGNTEDDWRCHLFARQLELRKQQEELEEGNSKWVLIGTARLLSTMRRLSSSRPRDPQLEEIKDAYQRLVKLDPGHAEYYREELGQLQWESVTINKSELSSRLVRSTDQNRTSLQLRLSNLSLHRLGCCGGLLWVQHLDLSHNTLRSVEGIEALQLLQSLDLSNNRISHSSGLSSLQLLPFLRGLNLASNLLGTSTVDTHTYSSALQPVRPSAFGVDGSSERLRRVLEGLGALKLRFLDMTSNAICQEETCKRFLQHLLPGTSITL